MPSVAISSDIEVKASSCYLDDYSSPDQDNFLFCYKIEITNKSDKTVQLQSRYWLIIDSRSEHSEVSGPGVVGKKPWISPGETYSYLSFSNLNTNFGTMEGRYNFVDEEENIFDVEIPRFFLSTNLEEFPKNIFKKGDFVRHKDEDYIGIVVDFDMYFLSNSDLDTQKFDPSLEYKPWYYVIIHDTDLMLYIPESMLLKEESVTEIDHPLLEVFFEKRNGKYFRKANPSE
ncbi:MAG: Co2+/Mg2+ efflux protein ApaG [Candidatus Caenarcaniphilales bacterium]|nr:Co2+/Mg2+ efflux protein ApaG [Candidatus Caenarcaniphilales bacterium]